MLQENQQKEQSSDIQILFESLPDCFLILKANPPLFTILDASNELLRTSNRTRAEIVGRNLFEAFPENPDDHFDSGPTNLAGSLRKTIDTKKPDHLPVLRYDVQNNKGVFEERYWKASNTPVLNEAGNLLYIIHSTEEVTKQVL